MLRALDRLSLKAGQGGAEILAIDCPSSVKHLRAPRHAGHNFQTITLQDDEVMRKIACSGRKQKKLKCGQNWTEAISCDS